MSDWSTAAEIAKAGAEIVAKVVELVVQAVSGDQEAVEQLKRVDDILPARSPVGGQFERADGIAEGKLSREDATEETP